MRVLSSTLVGIADPTAEHMWNRSIDKACIGRSLRGFGRHAALLNITLRHPISNNPCDLRAKTPENLLPWLIFVPEDIHKTTVGISHYLKPCTLSNPYIITVRNRQSPSFLQP